MGEEKTKLDEALARIRVLEAHRKQLMQNETLLDRFAMTYLNGRLSSGLYATMDVPGQAYEFARAMMYAREMDADRE